MKEMAAGGNIADLGQHEKTTRPKRTKEEFQNSMTPGHPDYKPYGSFEDEDETEWQEFIAGQWVKRSK